MKESKKSLFSLLLALSMAMTMFVAWPATAYAATDEVLIDVSRFVGASSNMNNGGDVTTHSQWSYNATSHVLGLNTENGNYRLTGTNNSITVYNFNAPGVNVTFDNLHITAPNNYSNPEACITYDNCTINLVGSSSLDGTNSTALKVANGSHCTITSSTGGELDIGGYYSSLHSCIYLDLDTDFNVTGNANVIALVRTGDGIICAPAATSHTISVGQEADLFVSGNTGIRATNLNLIVDGIASLNGIGSGPNGGYGIIVADQLLDISGSGWFDVSGLYVSAMSAQSILVSDDIFMTLSNYSSSPQTYSLTASDASSSAIWVVLFADYADDSTATDRTVSIEVPPDTSSSIRRTVPPVCRNVDTGMLYTTLAAAVAEAASGETIQLRNNIVENGNLEIYTKDLIIDMDGLNISMVSGDIVVMDGYSLTFENGGTLQTNKIGVYNGSLLVIAADLQTTETTIVQQSAFVVAGNIDSLADGILADANSIVSIEGNITTTDTGVELRVDAKVAITGNIKAGNIGVKLAGVDSLAQISGNIEANGNGVDGFDGTVNVIGNINAGINGVFAMDGCRVTILGSIFAVQNGIEAKDGAVVVVEEGITTTNAGNPISCIGVNAFDGASVTVKGPINTSGVGVYAVANIDPVSVTVNASINAGNIGLYSKSSGDSVDIVVNGDITALGYGVYAEADGGSVSVTVKGDISTRGFGIDASNSSNGVVTVSLAGSILASDCGVDARNEGTLVEVTGNITADSKGLFALDNSVVKLTGDIVAGDNAVYAENAAKVTVQGSIIYDECGIKALGEDTLVTMTGNITDSAVQLDMNFWEGAIYARDSAKVVLNGNITTHDEDSIGVQTCDNATVIVNGNIQTSGVNAAGVYAANGNDGDVGGSEVTINGNISSTDAVGVGVFSAYGSKVTVNGTITAPRYVVLLDTTVPSGSGEINRSITSNDATSSINGYLQYSGGDPLSWVWVRAEDEIVPPVVEPPIVVPPVIVQPKPPVVVPPTGDAGVLAGLTVSFLVLAAAYCLLKRRAKLLR
jgi:hypothetical protein